MALQIFFTTFIKLYNKKKTQVEMFICQCQTIIIYKHLNTLTYKI